MYAKKKLNTLYLIKYKVYTNTTNTMSYERMMYTTDVYNVNHLINYFNDGQQPLWRDNYYIPEHQRNYVWKTDRAEAFIISCLCNRPCPSIIVRKVKIGGETMFEVEDGQQRLTALIKFMNDKFTVNKTKYSELSDDEKEYILEYKIAVTTITKATDEQIIVMFNRLQDGCRLTCGENIHANASKPFVYFTQKMLMKTKEDVGEYYERMRSVWGNSECADTRYAELTNCTALMNGIVHGWSKTIQGKPGSGSHGISKKFEELSPNISKPISDDMKCDAKKLLDKLFQIYEEAALRKPLFGNEDNIVQGEQRKIGNFTGAIVYSLKENPDDWERIREEWVEFIVMYRSDFTLEKHKNHTTLLNTVILNNISSSSSWNEKRWSTTYEKVREFVSRAN